MFAAKANAYSVGESIPSRKDSHGREQAHPTTGEEEDLPDRLTMPPRHSRSHCGSQKTSSTCQLADVRGLMDASEYLDIEGARISWPQSRPASRQRQLVPAQQQRQEQPGQKSFFTVCTSTFLKQTLHL